MADMWEEPVRRNIAGAVSSTGVEHLLHQSVEFKAAIEHLGRFWVMTLGAENEQGHGRSSALGWSVFTSTLPRVLDALAEDAMRHELLRQQAMELLSRATAVPLPAHRTEANYGIVCSTCDGGGCPDCTDPA